MTSAGFEGLYPAPGAEGRDCNREPSAASLQGMQLLAIQTSPAPMKERAVSYYFSKTIEAKFDDAVSRTREALKQEGFGVITEIDVRETLKSKIGVDFRPYLILGACNPTMAYEALQVEDKVGAMLPCNVVVQERSASTVEIAAIDPVASMQAIENPALTEKAALVAGKLQSALDRI